MKYTFVDTCFGTHHLQFGYDANDTLWMSGTGAVVGWINSKLFLETGDAAKAQGWAPYVLDTNGNGVRDAGWVEPGMPVDPTKDTRIAGGNYAVMPNPVGRLGLVHRGRLRRHAGFRAVRSQDATVGSLQRAGAVLRHSRRRHRQQGRGVGLGVERPSGELRPQQVQGPAQRPDRDRRPVPGGLDRLQVSGSGLHGIGDNSAESSYYTWVDQHNVLGLGNDVPISTGNLNDGLLALKDGQFVVLRVPYPLGHYSKGLDGRIDDPAAGWKGRGVWTASGDRTPWLKEGGKGMRPLAVHFQVRPDPLAH